MRAGGALRALVLMLLAAALLCGAASASFTTSEGEVTVTESEGARAGGTIKNRSYAYPDGARLTTTRLITATAAPAQALSQMTIAGKGLVRWHDGEKWQVRTLGAMSLDAGTYHISTDRGSALVVTPQAYRPHENAMLEHLPESNGKLIITPENGGFRLTLQAAALPAGVYCETMIARWDGQLVDWNKLAEHEKWAIYCFTGDHRWTMDGYYYVSPSSYYPYGPNYYYSLPAAHIAGRMMQDEDMEGSKVLGLMMLDVMRGQRIEQGYVPSRAGSVWLRDEYGIGPGYFDTRFNVDLGIAMLNAVERYGIEGWTEELVRFGDYLYAFAEKHHYLSVRSGRTGWLVADYGQDESGSSTHCSLNHQLAEAIYFYRLHALTGEKRFAEAAELLTTGVEYSAVYWVKPDGDLYYCYNPDGSFDKPDYPYLTYNDLKELQALVTAYRGSESRDLATLMRHKRIWMDRNGITEYNK